MNDHIHPGGNAGNPEARVVIVEIKPDNPAWLIGKKGA